jgi:putative transposase
MFTSSYYVTIAAQIRGCLFGEIGDGEKHLNDYGRIAREEWLKTTRVLSNVEFDEFEFMPNHIHGFLVIMDNAVGANCRLAPTEHRAPLPDSLDAIMAQFKSIVTKRINTPRGMPGGRVCAQLLRTHHSQR